MLERPAVLAHRGANRRAPENTIEAFRIACELGADGVELDVRRTADGALVVHHDVENDDVGRIRDLDFYEVRAAAPTIPTLEEALDTLPGMLVNIEIKCLPWEPDADPQRHVVDAVTDLVAARGIVDSTIVSSFDLEAVNAVRARDPRIRTGWLVYQRDLAEAAQLVADLGHAALHADRRMVVDADPEAVASVLDLGVDLNVWTVNDAAEFVTLAELGVTSIITDVPDEALSALR